MGGRTPPDAPRWLLLVVAHIVDPRVAIRTHASTCLEWRCVFVTHDSALAYPGEVVVVQPNTTGCPPMRAHILSAYWHMDGLALLRRVWEARLDEVQWYALFDDNTNVFPGRILPFLSRTHAYYTHSVYYGDFSDQGRGFACGGGGFLLSQEAFRTTRFEKCRVSCVNANQRVPFGLDLVMDGCMKQNSVRPMRMYSCGTCGHQWSANFTATRIVHGTCLHMQKQQSHTPARYAALLKNSTRGPAFVHRMYDIL